METLLPILLIIAAVLVACFAANVISGYRGRPERRSVPLERPPAISCEQIADESPVSAGEQIARTASDALAEATAETYEIPPASTLPVSLDPREINREIYLDIETQRLSDEVEGGWSNIKAFGLAVAVTWNLHGQFRAWTESEAAALIAELGKFDRIVTYNGERFDFEVLRAYGDVRKLHGKSFDVLKHIKRATGRLVKLDHVVSHTLGIHKSGDGIDSVRWWRQGEHDKVIQYCRNDVQLLVRLVGHARQKGYVVIDGEAVRVNWSPLRSKLTRAATASS